MPAATSRGAGVDIRSGVALARPRARLAHAPPRASGGRIPSVAARPFAHQSHTHTPSPSHPPSPSFHPASHQHTVGLRGAAAHTTEMVGMILFWRRYCVCSAGHRSHFGSRYKTGCCGHAGLLAFPGGSSPGVARTRCQLTIVLAPTRTWNLSSRWRPYRVECTGSLPTSEVKRRRARLVLGWGTAREDLWVLPAFAFAFFSRLPASCAHRAAMPSTT